MEATNDFQNQRLAAYLNGLLKSPKLAPQIVCHRSLPTADERFGELVHPLPPAISDALQRKGIVQLYTHQVEAINLVRNGQDIIVATPTASGKSMIYNLPVLERYLLDPDARALYLFPLKALARDQRNMVESLHDLVQRNETKRLPPFASVYDGDTDARERGRLRNTPAAVMISNPDMVHLSFLPYHESWGNFFRNLQFVVIDELHVYRGLFGAHMSWVIRRLQRIAAHYQASPQFILLSATVGNPGHLAEKLIGRPVTIIDHSGAPTEEKHLIFINPWDSAAHTAAQLLESAVKQGLRTIVYTKSRRMTELISMWTKPRLGELADKIASYRAGFLPEDRRDIEYRLTNGSLLAVISTSALELGIDIGDLDLCILVGYPGSIMATWQRSGRVGRGKRTSIVIMIAGEDALDQYFMNNPDDFFKRQPERAALDPANERISRQHLHCAAAELPIVDEERMMEKEVTIRKTVEKMTEEGLLLREQQRRRWHASQKLPQLQVDLRSGGSRLVIIHRKHGEIIGEIDANRALQETHPGAIYLHHSDSMIVEDLNLAGQEVIVDDCKPSYYTRPTVNKQTEIIEVLKTKQLHRLTVCWGRLKVTEQVTGYRKINQFTGKPIATVPLNLPEQIIETEGIWLNLPEGARQLLEGANLHFMGAIHAIEHAMIAMFPLHVLCDRNDIGGISCPYHDQTGQASIFIYDGYNGGAGLAEQAYEVIGALLSQTAATVDTCPCETGCPSCVHSPRCGSGNRPIDKLAAHTLLQAIISDALEEINDQERKPQNLAVSIPPPVVGPATTPRGVDVLPEHYCVFDLETKFSAEEVGGWRNIEKMALSVAVVYDSLLGGYVTYLEDEIAQLVEHLQRAQLVIGFNIITFDYRVIEGVLGKNISQLPTLDILREIHTRLGYRLGLSSVAEATLGCRKSADGLQALRWYREGKIKELASYCRKDVELTRDLTLFALEQGHLLFTNKAGATVRLPLQLDLRLSEILNS